MTWLNTSTNKDWINEREFLRKTENCITILTLNERTKKYDNLRKNSKELKEMEENTEYRRKKYYEYTRINKKTNRYEEIQTNMTIGR